MIIERENIMTEANIKANKAKWFPNFIIKVEEIGNEDEGID